MKRSRIRLNLRYLQLQPLCDSFHMVHAFSTRRGGVSSPPFSSLNLSFEVGDDPESVRENRSRLLSDVGVGDKFLVKIRQVHGDNILVIEEETATRFGFAEQLPAHAGDALITRIPGIILAVSVADCVPLLLFDRGKKAIGAVHGGWRSTANGLAAKVIHKMRETFGTRPEDCVAGIGPSIGVCCYEVDEPVIQSFSRLSSKWREWIRGDGKGRTYLDLPRANHTLLLESGVPEEAIFCSGYCVSCAHKLFFSHRRDGGRTGRMLGLIMMRNGDA